jgi:dipeptidase
MCDTLIATPAAARDGIMIFAKNSDREPNEARTSRLFRRWTIPREAG